MGQVIQEADAKKQITFYEYDPAGNLIKKGVWTANNLAENTKRYIEGVFDFYKDARVKKGKYIFVSASDKRIGSTSTSYQQAYDFIKEALDKDCPVACLAKISSYASEQAKLGITSQVHRVTITELFKHVRKEWLVDVNTNKKTLVKTDDLVDFSVSISTWGMKKEIMSFKSLWEEFNISSFEEGNVVMTYIDIKSREAIQNDIADFKLKNI